MNTDRTLYQSIARPALLTGFLLLIPLLAMQFTDEVTWTLTDFLVAGTLLLGTGLTYKRVTRKSGNITYRVAVGIALFTGLFLVWSNLAVGLIGSENNPFNLWYFGVPAVGITGALIGRFRPYAMAGALFATALAQALLTVVALIAGMQQSAGSSVIEIMGINGFFILMFLASALLFRYAAKNPAAE
ncbi:hypothetical protein [Fodinibius sediminis]|uniref:Uncharacterized protein n=1 Tax=Fodinibius sediminis TaxID=1214077 RepID=A0A521E5X6_9BACT|nr:hypothetical protein [Fodinibius sediminis]SMO79319.1 hypothetical protein SAMN06265218_113114 [Fodinibius sediminis]